MFYICKGENPLLFHLIDLMKQRRVDNNFYLSKNYYRRGAAPIIDE